MRCEMTADTLFRDISDLRDTQFSFRLPSRFLVDGRT